MFRVIMKKYIKLIQFKESLLFLSPLEKVKSESLKLFNI